MKKVLLMVFLAFWTINAFTQTEKETWRYFYNLIKDADGFALSRGYAEAGGSRIQNAELKSNVVTLEDVLDNFSIFGINEITGITSINNYVKCTVDVSYVIGNSISKKGQIFFRYDSNSTAKSVYNKMLKCLKHLAKKYNGAYNYDIFGD